MGKLSYLGRCVVIHGKSDGLTRDVDYPDVVEDLWVVEWDLSGDWDTTRLFFKKILNEGTRIRCMTPREMARFCIGPFMFATRSRTEVDEWC